jgi:hypothetical protein
VAQELAVPVIDLEQGSAALITECGPVTYMFRDGVQDNTRPNYFGAAKIVERFAAGIKESNLGLAAYLSKTPTPLPSPPPPVQPSRRAGRRSQSLVVPRRMEAPDDSKRCFFRNGVLAAAWSAAVQLRQHRQQYEP